MVKDLPVVQRCRRLENPSTQPSIPALSVEKDTLRQTRRRDSMQGKVVDIGCGKNKFKGAIGIDSDPDSDADIVCDAHNLLVATKGYALAVSRFVIEHLGCPAQAIKEMMRVADHCRITTDDASHWRLQSLIRHSLMEEDGSGHVALFQPEHLQTLIERVGGKVDRIIRHRSVKKLDRLLWGVSFFRPFLYRSFTIEFHEWKPKRRY